MIDCKYIATIWRNLTMSVQINNVFLASIQKFNIYGAQQSEHVRSATLCGHFITGVKYPTMM
jgi:hypothetical protein